MKPSINLLSSIRIPSPKIGGIIQRINAKTMIELNKDNRASLKLTPGSVVVVESYTSPQKTNTTTFAGVLISYKRKGPDTNFTLRNIIIRTGVEMRFSLFSPMIKGIKVLAEGKERRAKLYYLRDAPAKAFRSMLAKSANFNGGTKVSTS